MPKVSVIIPVYNAEKYLPKSLDSVCNQTLKDLEIICVNDCSTDNSLKILQEYAEKDGRIKLIDLKENKGAAAARNTGIKNAQGEYIGFLDSDDYIINDFYYKLYNSVKSNDADAAKGKLIIKDPVYSCEKDAYYDTNDLISQNSAYFYHSFTTGLYRTTLIKENNVHFLENCAYFEDPYFSILAAIHYKTLNIVDKALYYYIGRDTSMCSVPFMNKFPHEKRAITELVNILNNAVIDKVAYIIIYGFLLRHTYNMKDEMIYTDSVVEYLDFLQFVYSQCKYKKEEINFYFYEKKDIEKRIKNKERLAELKNNVKGIRHVR